MFLTWDDSDGRYDQQVGPIQRYSQTSLDSFSDPGLCGADASLVRLSASGAPEQARCGVGPRIPLLVISPYAKSNVVDNTFTDQSAIVQFIDDNWLGGKRLGDGAADATAGSLDNNFDFSHPVSPPLILDPRPASPSGARGRSRERARGRTGSPSGPAASRGPTGGEEGSSPGSAGGAVLRGTPTIPKIPREIPRVVPFQSTARVVHTLSSFGRPVRQSRAGGDHTVSLRAARAR